MKYIPLQKSLPPYKFIFKEGETPEPQAPENPEAEEKESPEPQKEETSEVENEEVSAPEPTPEKKDDPALQENKKYSLHDRVSHQVGKVSRVVQLVAWPTRKILNVTDAGISRLPGGGVLRMPVVGVHYLASGILKGTEKIAQAVLETGSQTITRGGELVGKTVYNTGKAVGQVLFGKNQKNNEHIGVSGIVTGGAKGVTLRDSVLLESEKKDLRRTKARGKIERKVKKTASETRKNEWAEQKKES